MDELAVLLHVPLLVTNPVKVLVPFASPKNKEPSTMVGPVTVIVDRLMVLLVLSVISRPEAAILKTPVDDPPIVEPESVNFVMVYVSAALLVHVPPVMITWLKAFDPEELVTVSVPLISLVPVKLVLKPPIFKAEPLAIVRFAQFAFALMVTVLPPSIKTLSPATGALAPEDPPDVADHVPDEFQLPVATE